MSESSLDSSSSASVCSLFDNLLSAIKHIEIQAKQRVLVKFKGLSFNAVSLIVLT